MGSKFTSFEEVVEFCELSFEEIVQISESETHYWQNAAREWVADRLHSRALLRAVKKIDEADILDDLPR